MVFWWPLLKYPSGGGWWSRSVCRSLIEMPRSDFSYGTVSITFSCNQILTLHFVRGFVVQIPEFISVWHYDTFETVGRRHATLHFRLNKVSVHTAACHAPCLTLSFHLQFKVPHRWFRHKHKLWASLFKGISGTTPPAISYPLCDLLFTL